MTQLYRATEETSSSSVMKKLKISKAAWWNSEEGFLDTFWPGCKKYLSEGIYK